MHHFAEALSSAGRCVLRSAGASVHLSISIGSPDVNDPWLARRYYNASDSIYYKEANRMEAMFEQYLSGRLAFEPAPQAA